MLKKKKTTASGKLVLVKSVRRHWTSGGCPFSADRSGTETAQPQNEILCSKGLGGAAPGKQACRFLVPCIFALSGGISSNEKKGRLHILLLIIRIFQFDGSVNDTLHNGQILLRAKL